MINITKFDNIDLIEIAEIELLCFSSPWSFNALNEFTKYEHNKILVAKIDSKIAGYVTYTCIFDEIQIANVATHPNYRKQGIAYALIGHLISDGKSNNSALITLEVRTSNIPAINLYKKCGFESCGLRKNYYSYPTEDAILMNYTF